MENKVNKSTLSVVMPIYNEEKTLELIISKVKKVKIKKEIILVDDGSTDGSIEIINKIKMNFKKDDFNLELKTYFHKNNCGKGQAVRSGFDLSTGEYTIIQDADLEYDPEDYFKLLKPALEGKGQVIYGSRFTGEHRNMFYWHWVGNKLLTFVTDILYNTTLSDMETCYKLFKTEIIKNIKLRSKRFDFEPEITSKILKKGIRIYEVPISYTGREFNEGKKISWRDGFMALWTLIKYRFVD